MTTETLQDEIVMTVFSSQGKNNNKINIKRGLLWEDVKKILKDNGYNIDSMRAIENTRKAVLEHPKAIVPDQDFNLHLYPFKSKGGAKKDKVTALLPRTDVCAAIKKHIAGHGDKAKKFFSEDKSYTNKSTEELNTLLTKWEKKHGPAPDVTLPAKKVKATAKDTVTQEQSEAISDVVGSLEKHAEVKDTNPSAVIRGAIVLLGSISNHENQVLIEEAITKLNKALILKPTPTEEEKLKQEHQELLAGLSNVNY